MEYCKTCEKIVEILCVNPDWCDNLRDDVVEEIINERSLCFHCGFTVDNPCKTVKEMHECPNNPNYVSVGVNKHEVPDEWCFTCQAMVFRACQGNDENCRNLKSNRIGGICGSLLVVM